MHCFLDLSPQHLSNVVIKCFVNMFSPTVSLCRGHFQQKKKLIKEKVVSENQSVKMVLHKGFHHLKN